MLVQKLAQQKRLLLQAASRSDRAEINCASHRETPSATRLQHHHRRAVLDRIAHRIQDVLQLSLGKIEHAIVVQWPSATHVRLRHFHFEPRVPQHLDRRPRDLRMKIIVKRVRPQNHVRPTHPRLSGTLRFFPPLLERFRQQTAETAVLVRFRRSVSPARQTSDFDQKNSRSSARNSPDAPTCESTRRHTPAPAATADDNNATETPPYKSPCPRAPGNRLCTPCTTDISPDSPSLRRFANPRSQLAAIEHFKQQPRPPARRVFLFLVAYNSGTSSRFRVLRHSPDADASLHRM